MIHQAFTIYDNVSQTYGRPMHFISESQCTSILKQFANEPDNSLNQIDFDLFHIGEYDDNTGKYTSLEAPKHLRNMSSLINPKTESTN